MNNNSSVSISSSSPQVKVGITAAELWIHLTIFYVFLCGIVSTLGNILIVSAILRSKQLRSRFFIIVAFLTVCRILLCLQFLIMGIYRILRTLNLAPSILPRPACHAVHFWLLVGLTLEMMLLLVLVLERALAITASSIYRQMTGRQAFLLCALICLLSLIIKLPPSYSDVDLSQRVSCVNSYSAPSDLFNSYTQNIDLALLVMMMVIYFLLIGFVHVRVKKLISAQNTSASSDSSALISMKRQLKLMPVLRNLVFAHCSIALISKILRTLAGVYAQDAAEMSARFTAYGGVFSTLDLFTNVITLLWSNSMLRRLALPWFPMLHSKSNVGGVTGAQTAIQGGGNKQVVGSDMVDMVGRGIGKKTVAWCD